MTRDLRTLHRRLWWLLAPLLLAALTWAITQHVSYPADSVPAVEGDR
ncbi:MAG: hypothetical protein RL885_15140 [Planctomycetota bacterium]